MKRIDTRMLILCASLVSSGLGHAQTVPTARIGRVAPHSAHRSGPPQSLDLLQLQEPRLPALATRDAIQITCPPGVDAAVCGYVLVPLDREHPRTTKLHIYFELSVHSGSAQA